MESINPDPTLHRLFEHLAWAHDRVFESLESEVVPPQALVLLGHTFAAEALWLARIRGEAWTAGAWPALDLEGCRRLGEATLPRLQALLIEDLSREVSYRTLTGEPYTSTLGDILLHLILHGTYHRGQIATFLRTSGTTPPGTDFIQFAREGSR